MGTTHSAPERLTDAALIARVHMLATRERAAIVDLVASLAEFDARSLYLGQGCASMFTYCTQVLHLSEHAAYERIGAARTARRFPVVLDLLRDGEITLTTIGLLGPHLRIDNHRELLATARHKSKREVELLAAAIRPHPPVEASIRKLPTPRIVEAFRRAALELSDPRLWDPGGEDAPEHLAIARILATLNSDDRLPGHAAQANSDYAKTPSDADTESATDRAAMKRQPGEVKSGAEDPQRAANSAGLDVTPAAVAGGPEGPHGNGAVAAAADLTGPSTGAASGRAFVVAPLSAERYRVQFTASRQTYERLRRAQDLMRHSVPDGNPAEIFDRALTLLVEHLERRKFAATSQPRTSSKPTVSDRRSRRISAAVKRQVWVRDGGRCAFVGTRGRCTERGFLEFHHVVPFAAGGASTIGNIQLRCRSHNAHEARQYYGPDHVPARKQHRTDATPTRSAARPPAKLSSKDPPKSG